MAGAPGVHSGSRLEIFDGVGHLPQLETPGRFIALCRRPAERADSPVRVDCLRVVNRTVPQSTRAPGLAPTAYFATVGLCLPP